MSKLVNGIPIIEAEPPMICSECGKIDEVRPYGRKGAEICFDCAEEIKDIVEHNMAIKLFGEPGELW